MASIREHTSSSGITTYRVLYRLGGRQKSTTFPTMKSAEKLRDTLNLLGVERGLAALRETDESGRLTVDDLFERWIEWKATTKVTARTLRDYRRDYRNWIKDRLGHRPAEALDEIAVQEWVDWMASKKLDPKSVADRHMILGSMYRFGSARSRRLVGHNPCQETQLPSKERKAPKGFTLAQWDAMHAWGREHEPDADDLLLFFYSTGWRFSEATALTPAAIEDYGDDPEHGIPVMFASVLGVHRMDEHDRRVYVEGHAKSNAGLRRINLPPEAARMIRRRIVGKGPSDLVFTSRTGSQWRSSNFLEREFARILAGAGIEKARGMGPHYLRHTHVAMLDRAGVSLTKTQRRIGHENLSTTFGVYGGMIDNTLSLDELMRLDAPASPPAGQVVEGQVLRPALDSPAQR